MTEDLVENWNAVVNKEDIVYHLGDFCMGNRSKRIREILPRLNGDIVLIAGNHDYRRDDKFFKKVVRYNLVVEDGGKLIELTHRPKDVTGEYDLAFCGHVHKAWKTKRKGDIIPGKICDTYRDLEFIAPCDIHNVGVDVRGFFPRTYEEIVGDI
tara:strand:+ start:2655 stop:3116 length:462 start_codon:yes stop_codon:yes gene_type:complete